MNEVAPSFLAFKRSTKRDNNARNDFNSVLNAWYKKTHIRSYHCSMSRNAFELIQILQKDNSEYKFLRMFCATVATGALAKVYADRQDRQQMICTFDFKDGLYDYFSPRKRPYYLLIIAFYIMKTILINSKKHFSFCDSYIFFKSTNLIAFQKYSNFWEANKLFCDSKTS